MRDIEEYFHALVEVPYQRAMEGLGSCDVRMDRFVQERPGELVLFKKHLTRLTNFIETLDTLKLDMSLEAVVVVILDESQKERDDWLLKQQEAFDKVDAEVDALKTRIESENIAYNNSIRGTTAESNTVYEDLEGKRQMLEMYSDKIFDMCNQYGISTTDVQVNETMFTVDQLASIYDEYLLFMQKEEKGGNNIITKLRNFLPDIKVQGLILLGVLIVCFTPVLDFVSIAFFFLLAANQISSVNKYKYYTVLAGVTFNVNPLNMGYRNVDPSQLLPEELSLEAMDEDERFAPLIAMYDEIESEFAQSDPALDATRVMAEWSQVAADKQTILNGYILAYNERVVKLKERANKELEWVNKEYERLRAEYKFIGDRWSKHLSFANKYTLGLYDDCMEESIEMGDQNIVIRPCADETLMRKFLQALYVNAISNVQAGKLRVTVYDPNDFGRRLMPFYKGGLKEVLDFKNDDLNKILDECINEVQENFKAMSGKTINEFNKVCEETGITPIPYRLIIILSQPKTMEEDEKLQSFFEYSATGGCYIWMVSDVAQPKDAYVFEQPFQGIQHPITNIVTDEWCGSVATKYIDAIAVAKPPDLLWKDFIANVIGTDLWKGNTNSYIDLYPGYHDGDPNLYKPYTIGNDGNIHAIGVGTSGAGKSVFLNHLINTACREYSPKEMELWLCDFKGAEFQAYMNLPRPKAARLCKPQKVAEGAVPIVLENEQEVFGYYSYNEETGEYTFSAEPTADCTELHKFKQELKEGKPKEKNGKPIPPVPVADRDYADNMESYALPHVTACLCTSDGAFATSLFAAYSRRAEKRYADLSCIGVKNMPGWNTKVKSLLGTRKPEKMIENHTQLWKEPDFNPIWTEKDFWTRVLFVCDEFQVIFQKADTKDVEQIKTDITYIAKVARACGMHIFFTSQSMKGTISSDILANFTLRFALRCEPEVSQDIIGSTRASDIRAKNGYLIVQSQEMKTPEDQKCYKTPFLNDNVGSGVYTESELYDNIRELHLHAEELGWVPEHVITYDEKTTHPISELVELYEQLDKEGRRPESGAFFLGNRMAYSTNKAPDNIIIGAANNTNIMACFNDLKDYVMFFTGLMENIKQNKTPGTVIINSQVRDLAYLTNAESYLTFPDKHMRLLSEKTTCVDFLKWCEGLVESRRKAGKKDTPVWIFLLGWDKGKGFAIDPDSSARSKMNSMLQTAGEYHIHFIFINTGMTGISMSTVSACCYKIAGKCSLDDSTVLLNNKAASLNYEIATGWMFMNNNGVQTRDKLWVYKSDREIAATEIIL